MGPRLTIVTCILVACCVYIRHRQVSQWQLERGNDLVSKRIVVVTAWCGILACFGLDILANFQEARVVGAHMIGAMTCFTAGTIYFCLQVRDTAEITIHSLARTIVERGKVRWIGRSWKNLKLSRNTICKRC